MNCQNQSPIKKQVSTKSKKAKPSKFKISKRQRAFWKTTPELKTKMNSLYSQNMYPEKQDLEKIAEEFNVPVQKIVNWFKQKRRHDYYDGKVKLNDKYQKEWLTTDQQNYLQKEFKKCLKPCFETYKEISEIIQVSEKHIKNWFAHQRQNYYKNSQSIKIDKLNSKRIKKPKQKLISKKKQTQIKQTQKKQYQKLTKNFKNQVGNKTLTEFEQQQQSENDNLIFEENQILNQINVQKELEVDNEEISQKNLLSQENNSEPQIEDIVIKKEVEIEIPQMINQMDINLQNQNCQSDQQFKSFFNQQFMNSLQQQNQYQQQYIQNYIYQMMMLRNNNYNIFSQQAYFNQFLQYQAQQNFQKQSHLANQINNFSFPQIINNFYRY